MAGRLLGPGAGPAAEAGSGPAATLHDDSISIWAAGEGGSALAHALLASFSVILVSELGDKTFIITAIMAMKNSRLLVFVSSALALFLMTVLSVGMGVAVTVIPKVYTHYASIVLFVCFGFKMLLEAYELDEEAAAECDFDQVKRDLDAAEEPQKARPLEGPQVELERSKCHQAPEEPQGAQEEEEEVQEPQQAQLACQSGLKAAQPPSKPGRLTRLAHSFHVAPVVIKVFTMVFVAEWGDRSQISTVILSAREDVVGVFVGSLGGHLLCTLLAVVGGRLVAEMISVRTMTFIGALTFLFFGLFALLSGPD